ncbi:hypothetical protein AKJ16_DCAP07005 [Drosera capensis]
MIKTSTPRLSPYGVCDGIPGYLFEEIGVDLYETVGLVGCEAMHHMRVACWGFVVGKCGLISWICRRMEAPPKFQDGVCACMEEESNVVPACCSYCNGVVV